MCALLFVLFSSFVLTCSLFRPDNLNYTCGPLYITIKASPRSFLVLNWDFNCDQHPTRINLVDDACQNCQRRVLDSVDVNNKSRGFYTTDVAVNQPLTLPGYWHEENSDFFMLQPLCSLPFFIESEVNGLVVDRKCLLIQPSWMENFGKLRIGSMMIPGTHNSGAWKGQPIVLKNFILNQEMSLWHQLVFGIRYFDIRVGIYEKGTVYITHGIARCTPLEPELDHIINFIKHSPKEIVIIDVHRFNNPRIFREEHHDVVLELLKRKLGNYLYYRSDFYYSGGPTLEDIWKTGRQIILSYNSDRHVAKTENYWLWNGVARDWGDSISLEKLRKYIMARSNAKNYGNPLRVLMAELTPTKFYVALHPLAGLRNLADDVNPNLGFWLRDRNRSDNVNIVATDFFLGNDMINLAIETNYRKLRRLSL